MVVPRMFLCDESHEAVPSGAVEVGRNPPWNHPQVTPAVFRRCPMFCPDIDATSPSPQSSNSGSGSPINVPLTTFLGMSGEAPCVCPDTRLIAPGVDGPN